MWDLNLSSEFLSECIMKSLKALEGEKWKDEKHKRILKSEKPQQALKKLQRNIVKSLKGKNTEILWKA